MLTASALVGIALTFPACSLSGLNFKQDDRLTIVAPEERAKIRFPLTVRWRVSDFEITGRDGSRRPDAGYFGVYIDRAPQAPGETQVDLVRDDPSCRIAPDCPSPEYLARMGIHSTDETSFTIDNIADTRPADQRSRRRFHEVTIVLLDGRGERIGESAFRVRVEV